MRDPEQVARAQHAAARLESAWERWRSLQGLADTPAQPVVGYVGYALKEPWGQPRAVIGFSADEAERLAEFLEHGNAEGLPQQSSASTFTSQPTFTPQTATAPAVSPPAAAPAVPPPTAQRQSGQRHTPAHASSQRSTQSRASGKNSSKSASAASSNAKSNVAAEVQQDPSHGTAVPEQAVRADLAADRSLRASYPVHRVDSASYQELVPQLTDRGRST